MEVIVFNVILVTSVVLSAAVMRKIKDVWLSRTIDDFNRKSS